MSNSPNRPRSAYEMVRNRPRDYQYDVALSFAGEDREIARRIAHIARANGLSVFIDEHHLWEIWGQNLSEYLEHIYGGAARYCVILVSEDYCQKPYTIHERRIALARAMETEGTYVLPVVLDDSWLPGLPRTTSYFDLRQVDIETVAAALVKKAQGDEATVDPSWTIAGPAFTELEPGAASEPPTTRRKPIGPLDFAFVAPVAECNGWEEGPPYASAPWSGEPVRWTFRGGCGYYEDPIFEITLVNRSEDSRLVSRVGIEASGISHRAYAELGGGGQPIELNRTYELQLPDLWATLARKVSPETAHDWVNVSEHASCRLPDPVLILPGRAYRFGLHLFDYTNFCPTEVELRFLVATDVGSVHSERARLSYLIGSLIPPLERFRVLLGSDGKRPTHPGGRPDSATERHTDALLYSYRVRSL